jgi:transposase-like protein
VIANNSAASIEAFVRANVKPGTTLLTDGHASYPGLSGYRHDPRVVGTMAGHVVLPWSHRAFSLLKRWALGTYHGLRRKHVDTYLNEFVFRTIVASIAMFHSKRCSGSPPTTSPPAIGTSSIETILAKAPAGRTRRAYYI